MGKRVPASAVTRKQIEELMRSVVSSADGRSEQVRPATRLLLEEAAEAEALHALRRECYRHGGGQGHRNG